jgi:hypothetical protein
MDKCDVGLGDGGFGDSNFGDGGAEDRTEDIGEGVGVGESLCRFQIRNGRWRR